MKDYDVYLFDWDGTLAQSHEFWLKCIRSQLERHGIELSDKAIVRQFFGRYFKGLDEVGFTPEQIHELDQETQAAAEAQMPLVDLYPGADELLRLLKARGKKLALITTSYRQMIEASLTNHRFVELFDVVVTGDEVTAPKPDPVGIHMVLNKLDVPPARAIMIGDSPHDILAGHNGGTDSLLFYPPEHELRYNLKELEQTKPTYLVRSWTEVLAMLRAKA